MSSRSVDDLNPFMQRVATIHKQLCAAAGIEILLYCTLRSRPEQDELYTHGRTAKGRKVTNARGGESAHNPDEDGKTAAYDGSPMISGKPMWDEDHPSWAIYGRCAEEAGAIWAGRWTGSIREKPHCQDPSWKKPSR